MPIEHGAIRAKQIQYENVAIAKWLQLSYFNLSNDDLNQTFEAGKEIGLQNATLSTIIDRLKLTYCDSIGVEFMHCQNEKLREWMISKMEPLSNRKNYKRKNNYRY